MGACATSPPSNTSAPEPDCPVEPLWMGKRSAGLGQPKATLPSGIMSQTRHWSQIRMSQMCSCFWDTIAPMDGIVYFTHGAIGHMDFTAHRRWMGGRSGARRIGGIRVVEIKFFLGLLLDKVAVRSLDRTAPSRVRYDMNADSNIAKNSWSRLMLIASRGFSTDRMSPRPSTASTLRACELCVSAPLVIAR